MEDEAASGQAAAAPAAAAPRPAEASASTSSHSSAPRSHALDTADTDGSASKRSKTEHAAEATKPAVKPAHK